VKGHAGNIENERCDVLAVAASESKNLPADIGYEAIKKSAEGSIF
jgi:ribonuclease HI